MKNNSSSERHTIKNIKVILNFDNFFYSSKILSEVNEEDIHHFLDSKIKSIEIDPDKKWITTWDHYLNHLFLFRWLYNEYTKTESKYCSIDYLAKQIKPCLIIFKPNSISADVIPKPNSNFGKSMISP